MSGMPAIDEPRLALIFDSYRRLTGKSLLGDTPFSAEAMWDVSCAIVAHGTQDDPVFFYGNRCALQLFEMDFTEFTRLPSRLSAEPQLQASRAVLMEKVTRLGVVDGYRGVRVTKSGGRFNIADGTVWNLLDEAGIYHGQAATFIALA